MTSRVITETIQKRIDELRNDPEFIIRYAKWTQDITTQECLVHLTRVFTRPPILESPITGEDAILAQGMNEGAWQVLDMLQSFQPTPTPQQDVPVTYGVEDEQAKAEETERK